jgi:hypothetical protein
VGPGTTTPSASTTTGHKRPRRDAGLLTLERFAEGGEPTPVALAIKARKRL